MFNIESEKKIIEYIKKSPLGVTSTEIANYIGLNRMTITKYLAIIKERALIDFKQFGMAKLWYIPVNISKETFLNKALDKITANIPPEELKSISEKAGLSLGEEINKMYLSFFDAQKLNLNQIIESYSDIGKKLGGIFKIRLTGEKISVEIIQSPFDGNDSKTLIQILSVIFAKIAFINKGYARSVVSESKENKNSTIDIFLKKEDKHQ